MTRLVAHKWAFAPRFRRHAFGWRSQPAVQRVREAVAEIQKVAKRDPALAAVGAVLFLEKVSPALEQVDSSSGAIGTVVDHAIETCAKIIAEAPVDDATRDRWLARLWEAHRNDEIPYIERMADYWGEVCASRERASTWADRLIGTVEAAWSPTQKPGGYFHGTTACLSALFHAGRYEELLALLDRAPDSLWYYREWGVKALVATGRKAEAIRYAEASRGLNDNPIAIARACEKILLSSGLADEAYARYAIAANQGKTFLATFRAIAKKYPTQAREKVLDDLVASTPGQEGKWFAAAKDAGLYDEAIALAQRTPCDPRTLTRAARDFAATKPRFAVEAGLAALRWIAAGYGYEITGVDLLAARSSTLDAAKNGGWIDEIEGRIRALVAGPRSTAKELITASLGTPTNS
jgi:tetratricopeptide (TPR) repeat protein